MSWIVAMPSVCNIAARAYESCRIAPPSNDSIERIEGQLLTAQRMGELPSVDIPLKHFFQPGIYIRQVFMPAGSFVIGHEHRWPHWNSVVSGVASVMFDGKMSLVNGPQMIWSEAGVRKILYIHEDTIWQTFHQNPDNETDIPTMEFRNVVKSASYQQHLAELETLKRALIEGQSE